MPKKERMLKWILILLKKKNNNIYNYKKMENQENNANQEEKKPATKLENISSEKDLKENKIFGILSYIGPLFLIALLMKKESPFAQFHAKQGMVLFIISFIVFFLIWIPLIGMLMELAILVFVVLGIINAASGKQKKLPWIGDFADKMKI